MHSESRGFLFFSFQSNQCQPQRLKRRARKRLVPVNKISRPTCKRRLLENYFLLILLFYHSAWNNENSGRLHALPCWDLGFKIWHSDVNKFDWLAKVHNLTSLSGSSLVEGRPWEPCCTVCATNSWQINREWLVLSAEAVQEHWEASAEMTTVSEIVLGLVAALVYRSLPWMARYPLSEQWNKHQKQCLLP